MGRRRCRTPVLPKLVHDQADAGHRLPACKSPAREHERATVTVPRSRHAVSLSSVVVAGKGQISSDLAGEAVILNLQTGMYYGLARVGARIWELIREPTRVADVRDAIVLEYDVDPARCQHDLLCLLEQLAD